MLPSRSHPSLPILLLLSLAAATVHAASFQPGSGEPLWVAATQAGRCELSRDLGDYGVARFSAVPGEGVAFELLGHRDLFGPGPVPVHGVTPPWHPDHPARRELGALVHLASGAVVVAEPLATTLLMTLYEGRDLRLEQQPWYAPAGAPAPASDRLEVLIPGRSLRGAYGDFARCLRGTGSLSWASMERSRFNYDSNDAELDAAQQQRLTRLAEFVAGDASITAVYVDGHSDDVGGREANYRLARERAEGVAEQLAAAGVPRERLVVRYHGAAYPVASNATEDGRARNRRSTVRLERQWQMLAGTAGDADVDDPEAAGEDGGKALP